jgi:hypothetical protein
MQELAGVGMQETVRELREMQNYGEVCSHWKWVRWFLVYKATRNGQEEIFV